MNGVCCECKQPLGKHSVLVCADCGGVFHYPDARINEPGEKCGAHEFGFRNVLGADVVSLCLRCDMAFRLKYGIPA